MHETDLERIESADMMRVLENCEKVHMVKTEAKSFSVDIMEKLIFLEKKMLDDPLTSEYETDNG
jgi:3-deoxy-manno-octulosonate cytidylyltransferase (CMP-KDO synthetase)